jgi:phosphatidylinositol dimannoside acyltransferase
MTTGTTEPAMTADRTGDSTHPPADPFATRRRTPRAARSATVVQRLRVRLVELVSWIACRLPVGVGVRIAEIAGELWYRLTPARAAQARMNLDRVCRHLAATGRASALVERAARHPSALERLVRHTYRHAARYYLEVLRIPAMTPAVIERAVTIETPEIVDRAFASGQPVVFVGLHFGAIELPGLYLAHRTGQQPTAPMETLGDPALQDWMVRTRGRVGVRIVDLREARHELLAAIRRGEPVGLIADRIVGGGGGLSAPLFGAPAPIPVGPALLAIETGTPIYVAGVRRAGPGQYLGRLAEVPLATEGNRRQRLEATVVNIARAFEDVVATAPEQWWAVFFPIWPDLEAAG